jgi:hypothetical protein
MVMAGEGNGDAFLTVAGIAAGGAIAHNLGAVSSAEGPTAAGKWAVGIGLAIAVAYAAAMTAKKRG